VGEEKKTVRCIDWTLWGPLVLAATLELVGDLAFKWWAETNCWEGLVSGLIVYGLALIVYGLALIARLLRRAELAVIFILWVGVAAVLLALAGWWFFDEALSLRHLAGLALIIGGMILLGSTSR